MNGRKNGLKQTLRDGDDLNIAIVGGGLVNK